MLTNKVCSNKLSYYFQKCEERDSNTVKNDGGSQIMDAFTITEMHYLVVKIVCDLVWPLCLLYLYLWN